jgi:hypothetical protein
VGIYVGQTARDPDWRFDQHKAGYRASRAVRRFGIRLLPELVEHLNPIMQWESLDLEAALAGAFLDAGISWVEAGHKAGRIRRGIMRDRREGGSSGRPASSRGGTMGGAPRSMPNR